MFGYSFEIYMKRQPVKERREKEVESGPIFNILEGECFYSVLIIYYVHRTSFLWAWVLVQAAFWYEAWERG